MWGIRELFLNFNSSLFSLSPRAYCISSTAAYASLKKASQPLPADVAMFVGEWKTKEGFDHLPQDMSDSFTLWLSI